MMRLLYSPSDALPAASDWVISDAAGAEVHALEAGFRRSSGDSHSDCVSFKSTDEEQAIARSIVDWATDLPALAFAGATRPPQQVDLERDHDGDDPDTI